MKRMLATIDGALKGSRCCPGHDAWPAESYANSRSKKARAKGKGRENRAARRILNQKLREELQ